MTFVFSYYRFLGRLSYIEGLLFCCCASYFYLATQQLLIAHCLHIVAVCYRPIFPDIAHLQTKACGEQHVCKHRHVLYGPNIAGDTPLPRIQAVDQSAVTLPATLLRPVHTRKFAAKKPFLFQLITSNVI